jgi:hypothetical protein
MWSSWLVGIERDAAVLRRKGAGMTPHMKFGIAGVIIGILLLISPLPWYVPVLIIALAIAIPIAAYSMLDPSQRRRLRRARGRKQLGG